MISIQEFTQLLKDNGWHEKHLKLPGEPHKGVRLAYGCHRSCRDASFLMNTE